MKKSFPQVFVSLILSCILIRRLDGQKFKVVKENRQSRTKDKRMDIGWRLSTRQDAEDLASHVQAALKKGLVYTIQLQDGYLDVDEFALAMYLIR